MNNLGRFVAVVMVAAGLFAPRALAARTDAPVTKLPSAEIHGFVFYADGVTPAADVPVRVWDFERREFIYQTQTDENGRYTLPKLAPGKYYVTYDWMKLQVLVIENGAGIVQQPHDVVVVIPRGLGFMSVAQLNAFLTASTLTEMTLIYENDWQRPEVVSP